MLSLLNNFIHERFIKYNICLDHVSYYNTIQKSHNHKMYDSVQKLHYTHNRFFFALRKMRDF